MRTFLALAVFASAAMTSHAADIKSGLQVGDYPGAYQVIDITGPSAGLKLCYRCKYGTRPVVNIFTRKMDDNVTQLISQLDSVVGKNRDNKLAAFVVVLTDDPDTQEKNLKAAAAKHNIKNTPLTVFENSAGPNKYRIAKDADVTVMMWVEGDVKVNHALKSADLNSDAIKKIVGDTSKILN